MYPNTFGNRPLVNEQVFMGAPTITAGPRAIWTKPRNAVLTYIMLIGAGGNGGPGASGNVGGGGGGGTGGILKLLIPTIYLPDRLYLTLPIGGSVNSAMVQGTPGSVINIESVLLQASTGNTGGTGGAAGATGGTGLGGSIRPLATFGLAKINTTIQQGATGGTSAAGDPIVAFAAAHIGAGAGGGGAISNGGEITGGDLSPTIPGGIGVASGTGNRGADGLSLFGPIAGMLFTGGSGGGGTSVGTGGAGGKGGIGCGGGGGGASGVSGTGGAGGQGGESFCGIWCYA